MAADEVAEHHKLVATGLGCLNVALQSNKLYPRLEARLCLRYAGVLIEETTNISEAETILTRGISVCDKVMKSAFERLSQESTNFEPASLSRPEVQLSVYAYEDPIPAESESSFQIHRKPHLRLYNVRGLL